MGEVKVQGQRVGPTFSYLFRAMAIGPPIPEMCIFQNWILNIKHQGRPRPANI